MFESMRMPPRVVWPPALSVVMSIWGKPQACYSCDRSMREVGSSSRDCALSKQENWCWIEGRMGWLQGGMAWPTYPGYIKWWRLQNIEMDHRSHSRLAQFQWACVIGLVNLGVRTDGEWKDCHHTTIKHWSKGGLSVCSGGQPTT